MPAYWEFQSINSLQQHFMVCTKTVILSLELKFEELPLYRSQHPVRVSLC